MKNLKRIILLVTIVLGCSMPLLAQSGFSARISSNVLLRALALFIISDGEDGTPLAVEYADDPAYNASYLRSCLVPLRFNFGVKYQYNLVDHLDAFASADMFYKNLKGKDAKSSSELGTDEVLPASVNFPLILGLNYAFYNTTDLSLWTEAGVGANLRRVTSQEVVLNGSNVPDVVTTRHLGVTPTWRIGVGAIFDEHFSLELQYCSFGASQVRGGAAGGVIGDWAHKFAGSFKTLAWDNSVLFLCLGFHF